MGLTVTSLSGGYISEETVTVTQPYRVDTVDVTVEISSKSGSGVG